MNTKLLWKIVWLIVGAALVLTIGFGFANWASAPTQISQLPQTQTISLTVQGVYTDKQVTISLDETALQVLQMQNAQDPALQLSTKDYAGMGTLVEGMHGMTNGTGKNYWQYKVNGVMPEVGAGALQLKSGDSVEWFFTSSQE